MREVTQTPLSARERQVLEAVVRTYVRTAEPAGSRTIARGFDLGVSPATVRNTMADLEAKGYLFHPHASAGRIPTDLAYRFYVDAVMEPVPMTAQEQRALLEELAEGGGVSGIELLLQRAAGALGVLTGELGVALAPNLADAVLERLELAPLSSGKVVLVLTLSGGQARTVYIEVGGELIPEAVVVVASILNERLAGRSLREIRATLPERLRDSAPPGDLAASHLLNILVESGDELFAPTKAAAGRVHLGRTSVLARQPEFSSGEELKSLIELTEQRDLLATVLTGSNSGQTLRITIGSEHEHPELGAFTVVTSRYHSDGVSGVIGVVGPTRMPYEKVVAIVEQTSGLLSVLYGGDQSPRLDQR
ncbi:MAG: heat-inducible transcriptional repressor HrcA [Gemmatimonadota bacterium]